MQSSKLNRVNKSINKNIFAFNFKLLTLNFRDSAGFTLLELIIVIAIISALVGIATPSLLNFNQKAGVDTTITTLVSDIKAQQIKAMVGDTEGGLDQISYGVYFQPTGYVLFRGASYSASNTTNFLVNLPSGIAFSSINLFSSQIVFATRSGEILGYLQSSSLTAVDTINNDQKTIQLNRYGVITSVN